MLIHDISDKQVFAYMPKYKKKLLHVNSDLPLFFTQNSSSRNLQINIHKIQTVANRYAHPHPPTNSNSHFPNIPPNPAFLHLLLHFLVNTTHMLMTCYTNTSGRLNPGALKGVGKGGTSAGLNVLERVIDPQRPPGLY